MNWKKKYVTVTLTECFLFGTNLVLLGSVYGQYIKIDSQNLLLDELSSKLVDLQNSFSGLEQKMLLEKSEIVLIEKLVEDKTQFFLSSGFYHWCFYVLLLMIACYSGCYLYAKILNISIWTFLPKITVPSIFLPFLEKKEFFEFILGEFTVRLNVINGNVVSSEAKHLSDMTYQSLEDLLTNKQDFSKEVMNQTSKLYLDPEVASAVVTHCETLSSVFSGV